MYAIRSYYGAGGAGLAGFYTPVRRANFTVAETRVAQRTDFDSLTLTVETNGTISPEA